MRVERHTRGRRVPSPCRVSFRERRVEAVDQLLVEAREQVPVPVERQTDRGVTEPLLDRLRVCTLCDQKRGAGVAQVVEPKSGGDRRAFLRRENSDDPVGWVLLNLAVELARRALLAVA